MSGPSFCLCLYVPHGGPGGEPRVTEQRGRTKTREALRGSSGKRFQTRKANRKWALVGSIRPQEIEPGQLHGCSERGQSRGEVDRNSGYQTRQ